MSDETIPMLAPWHQFYELLGTAAAALMALLFVAASIGASVLTPDRAGPTRTYLSPVIFHYSNILFLSLIALIPELEPKVFGITIAVAATASLIYSIYIFQRLFRDGIADLADRLAYGAVPVAAYATGLVVAYLMLTGSARGALYVLAGASLLLLIVNIRNAWDLMLALARRATQEQLPKN
ncbi:MAG: hypothetical protein ACRECV_19650 [Xanthobacteraceae bacterium]